MKLPLKLQKKLQQRKDTGTLRSLKEPFDLVDFSSNDYLGFSTSEEVFNKAHKLLVERGLMQNGATGSRLLTGNHQLYQEAEKMLCEVHKSQAALIYNSGYDANVGLFASVPQRRDVVLYDELIHASIRDGIAMGNAKAYKFKHNDLTDLDGKIRFCHTQLNRGANNAIAEIYVVTESVFSMDGDSPNLPAIIALCEQYRCHLVVDEAHAVGVFGFGLVQGLGFQDRVFARIATFGKALGAHGAAILGGTELKEYLVNFSRSLIYTTALQPHSLATVLGSYGELATSKEPEILDKNIRFFKHEADALGLTPHFIESNSAIQACLVQSNESAKQISNYLATNGFDVKPILSPTVPAGKERLRFCLHSFNTSQQISDVLGLLGKFVKN